MHAYICILYSYSWLRGYDGIYINTYEHEYVWTMKEWGCKVSICGNMRMYLHLCVSISNLSEDVCSLRCFIRISAWEKLESAAPLNVLNLLVAKGTALPILARQQPPHNLRWEDPVLFHGRSRFEKYMTWWDDYIKTMSVYSWYSHHVFSNMS